MKKLMQLLFLSALSVCLFAAGGKDMGNAADVKYTSKGT